MLYYFFSAEIYGQETQGLFDNLLISKETENYIAKYQGKYPVIFLSLKDTKKNDFDGALEEITNADLLDEGKAVEFTKAIERFLKMAASVHDYANQPEAFYQGFMLALSVSLMDHYYVFSNHESGLGRPDLMIIPKDTQKNQAVILEFKTVTGNQTLEQRAQEGLAQIQARDYASVLQQYNHINTALQVSMSFDEKTAYCLQKTAPLRSTSY